MDWNRAVLAAAVAVMSGCATFGGGGVGGAARSLSSDPTMPAAEGQAKFSMGTNDNTAIDVNVKHLAQPEKLTPPASTYVVWTQAKPNEAPQNIGQLKVDKDLSGTIQTVTPLHSFDLFITAEGSGQVQSPTGKHLLWTSYSQ